MLKMGYIPTALSEEHTVVTRPHGQQDLANVHPCNRSVGLAPSATHSSLQSIGAGTGQHLVDADDMVRMCANTEMETFLAGDLDKVPVT
jgi:hypothetical protein